jgi:hypothetical protein
LVTRDKVEPKTEVGHKGFFGHLESTSIQGPKFNPRVELIYGSQTHVVVERGELDLEVLAVPGVSACFAEFLFQLLESRQLFVDRLPEVADQVDVQLESMSSISFGLKLRMKLEKVSNANTLFSAAT